MLAVAPLTSFTPDALASELVRLRTTAHLSQRRLAELAGVSNTAISALESRQAPSPHPEALRRLAAGLATNGSGEINERQSEAIYLSLMRAAGYLPGDQDDELRQAIVDQLGPDRAEHAIAILSRMRGRPISDLEKVVEITRVLLD